MILCDITHFSFEWKVTIFCYRVYEQNQTQEDYT